MSSSARVKRCPWIEQGPVQTSARSRQHVAPSSRVREEIRRKRRRRRRREGGRGETDLDEADPPRPALNVWEMGELNDTSSDASVVAGGNLGRVGRHAMVNG